jgi:Family of unknown function (DUF6064)
VNPPFTLEQFLGVFADYNAAIWPAQIVAYVLGVVAVAALVLQSPQASRAIALILAAMWAFNGIGYHYVWFSPINPAAKVFAVCFILEAMLFARCAASTSHLQFQIRRDLRSVAGASFILYAMLVYPILGIWAGHGLTAGPMFGVAPCPTTIFTIALLLFARGLWVKWLSIIPLLWSVVGLAAALQLGFREDLGLPVAGLYLLILIAVQMIQGRPKLDVAASSSGAARS